MWKEVPQTGEVYGVRWHHATAAVGQQVYLFGGKEAEEQTSNELYSLNGSTFQWTRLDPSGPLPPPRTGHTFTAFDDSFLLLGGRSGPTHFSDAWVWDIAAAEWRELGRPDADETEGGAFAPSARRLHSAVVYERHLYLYGGLGSKVEGDVWRLALNPLEYSRSPQWERVWSPDLDLREGGPAPRFAHAACMHDGCMYVFGGRTASKGAEITNELWRFHIDTSTWRLVTPLGDTPEPRRWHAGLVLDDFWVTHGGAGGERDQMLGSAFVFDFRQFRWSRAPLLDSTPTNAHAMAAVRFKNSFRIFLTGGEVREGAMPKQRTNRTLYLDVMRLPGLSTSFELLVHPGTRELVRVLHDVAQETTCQLSPPQVKTEEIAEVIGQEVGEMSKLRQEESPPDEGEDLETNLRSLLDIAARMAALRQETELVEEGGGLFSKTGIDRLSAESSVGFAAFVEGLAVAPSAAEDEEVSSIGIPTVSAEAVRLLERSLRKVWDRYVQSALLQVERFRSGAILDPFAAAVAKSAAKLHNNSQLLAQRNLTIREVDRAVKVRVSELIDLLAIFEPKLDAMVGRLQSPAGRDWSLLKEGVLQYAEQRAAKLARRRDEREADRLKLLEVQKGLLGFEAQKRGAATAARSALEEKREQYRGRRGEILKDVRKLVGQFQALLLEERAEEEGVQTKEWEEAQAAARVAERMPEVERYVEESARAGGSFGKARDLLLEFAESTAEAVTRVSAPLAETPHLLAAEVVQDAARFEKVAHFAEGQAKDKISYKRLAADETRQRVEGKRKKMEYLIRAGDPAQLGGDGDSESEGHEKSAYQQTLTKYRAYESVLEMQKEELDELEGQLELIVLMRQSYESKSSEFIARLSEDLPVHSDIRRLLESGFTWEGSAESSTADDWGHWLAVPTSSDAAFLPNPPSLENRKPALPTVDRSGLTSPPYRGPAIPSLDSRLTSFGAETLQVEPADPQESPAVASCTSEDPHDAAAPPPSLRRCRTPRRE